MEADDPDSKPVAKRARRNLNGERHDFTSKDNVHLPHNGTGGGDRAEENLRAPVTVRASAGSSGTEYGMFDLSFCRPGLSFGGDISLLTHLLVGPEGVSPTQHLPFNVVRPGGLIQGCPFAFVPNRAISTTSTMTAFPAMTAPFTMAGLTNLNNPFGRYLDGHQSGSQVVGARELEPQVLMTMVNGGSHLTSLQDHAAVALPIAAAATLSNRVQEGMGQTPKFDRTQEAAVALKAFPVSIEEDECIAEYHRTLRKQIEFFEASSVDMGARAQGRNVPIRLKQIGIRCIHCKNIPAGHRPRGAVYFPQKLASLYQTAQNMSTNHFHVGVCMSAPESTLVKLSELKGNKRSGWNGGCKRYWVESAKKLGIVDAPVTGLEYRKP